MNKTIAILMGGFSSEHDISIKSGDVVYQNLKNIYTCYRVVIDKTQWYALDGQDNRHTINKDDFSITIDQKHIVFDCAFNTIHGTPGEDGHIQAYLSLLSIPQTSCNMYQAALTFNKRDLLSVLQQYQIPTAKALYFNSGDTINTKEIVATVGLPCFIKANKSGSSFGVSKVYHEQDIENAIDLALEHDDEILIESFLDGTEVSVGVITYKEETKVLPVTEIVSENDFFDYQAKYEGKSQEITPARITKEQATAVSQLAQYIYDTLKMKGFARADFIFHNNTPHFIEINTTPGLSTESILPQQAKKAGIKLPELFSSAIEACF